MSSDDQSGTAKRRAVFISYARADRAKVTPIAEALEAAGYDVWWDALIDGGNAFARTIEGRLAAADAVVVVWSAASVDSDWVRDEAAHGRDRKRIVPVSLDRTEPPIGFRQYHALDFSAWRGAANGAEIDALIRSIDMLGDQDDRPAARVVAPGKHASLSRRAVLAGGAVIAIGGGLAVFKPWRASAAANSVAVLPFANLSGDPGQAYFSDGLAEEIRAALARNSQLQVAAPTSSNTFRDKARDAKGIGSQLGVGYLLEGSVRKAGKTVRIAADLIDTKTGFSSWSQSFDRDITDIFAVQTEIAATVADALAVQVADTRGAPGSTTNVAAFDAFLRGRALFNSDAGEDSDRGALAQFDAAIAADPKFAGAHAARSRVLAAIATQYSPPTELRAMYAEAIEAAKRAVALAPDLANAQLALAYAIYTGRLDVKGARAPFDRAYALGGGDADILGLYAIYCARVGRAEIAQQASARAIALDPLNPRAWRTAGTIAYAARRYDEAIARWKHALELNPKLSTARAMTGSALFLQGRSEEARASLVTDPNPSFRLAGLAIVERKLGNDAAARKAQADLITQVGDGALYQQAQILAQWGDTEAALGALERAHVVGDPGLLYLKIDPMLDPLRKTQRFGQLLKRIGFD